MSSKHEGTKEKLFILCNEMEKKPFTEIDS